MQRHSAHWLLAVLVSFLPLQAQQKPTVFRSESRLVVIDVVATDAKDSPVEIAPNEWQIIDSGQPQTIVSVDHQGPAAPAVPTLIGTGWTNNREQQKSPADTRLTVLVMDSLNMAPTEQGEAKDFVIHALRNLPAHERFIIFLLGGDLKQVSGYTDNLAQLEEALRKMPASNMQLMEKDSLTDVGGAFKKPLAEDEGLGTMSSHKEFERDVLFNAMKHRADISTDAMTQVADILARQPGRKSLIWVTSSFPPFGIGPGQVQAGFDKFNRLYLFDENKVAKMTRRLTEARVAIYPILINTLVSGMDTGTTPNTVAFTPLKENPDLFEWNKTYDRRGAIEAANSVADQTGGKATFNTNDFDSAFQRAVADGSNYYALSFAPSDKDFDGNFRPVQIRTSHPGVTLRYRAGYYATPDPSSQPDRRLETVLSLELPLSTELETVARLQAGPPAVISMRVSTSALASELQHDGHRRFSLLVGYVAAPKNGTAPLRSTNAFDITVNEEQWAVAQQQGLLLTLHPQVPVGPYLLRAGVLDRISRRVGTIDLESTSTAIASANSGRTLPPAPSGTQPETASLTSKKYTNYYFGFEFPLPLAAKREYLPIPAPGTHALLALSFEFQYHSGNMVVFAMNSSATRSIDPATSAREEAEAYRGKSKSLVWRGTNSFTGCDNQTCTTFTFFERRGYLLRFAATSQDAQLLQTLGRSLQTIEFRPAKPRSTSATLYEGPAIPGYVVEGAAAAKAHFPQGNLQGDVFQIPEFGLDYGIPTGWRVMNRDEGNTRFEEFRMAGVSDALAIREHQFFSACSQPLLHLREDAPDGNHEPGFLSLLIISPACLGITLPSVWDEKNTAGEFATKLSMLRDFGDPESAHFEKIANRPFLTFQGTLSYSGQDTGLQQRRFQTVYITPAGNLIVAWFLTGPKKGTLDALPATKLVIR